MVDAIPSAKSRRAARLWPHLRNQIVLKRIISWFLVASYTYFLPDVVLVYIAISKRYSPDVAGKIPTIIIIALGLAYAAFVPFGKRPLRRLALLAPCGVLAYVIISLESNPNKHIHIAEYILMSWILFEALSIDYRGKGIFLLIFICSSMLGMVDEVEQGIRANRFYGWSDMLINSTSTLIGICSLMGLRKAPTGDWAWIGGLKKRKGSLGLVIFGAIGAAFMCVYLLDVKSKLTFLGVYPTWLLAWNGLFLVLASVRIFCFGYGLIGQGRDRSDEKDPDQNHAEVTALLWILPPLCILLTMHTLVFLAFFFGWKFQ